MSVPNLFKFYFQMSWELQKSFGKVSGGSMGIPKGVSRRSKTFRNFSRVSIVFPSEFWGNSGSFQASFGRFIVEF